MSSVILTCFIAILSFVFLHVRAQGQYKKVCYYTNWAQYRPKEGKYFPEDIDPSLCTHLVYAFAKLNGNRLVAFEWNDESTEWMRGMYARFNDIKAKNRHIKTLIAIGGWNMASKPFTAMVATAAGRREFATTTVAFLRERKFDGVDLDWEYPANRGSPPEDKMRYTQLVAEIRSAFDEEARRTGRPALLLTSAVAAGKDKIDTAYEIPQICRDMDFISIMAYDLHGSWENITGHNSPLFAHSGETGTQRHLNMDWASNYWVQKGCPKEKLIIGMGLYGRSFTLRDPYRNGLMDPVRGKGENGKFTREGGFLAYYEVCQMLQNGGKSYYIKEQEAPYAVLGDQWVGYDDVDSLRVKVQWVKQSGFAGVMIWALDLDDFKNFCGQGRYPLLKAINQELGSSTRLNPVKPRPNRVKADLMTLPPAVPTIVPTIPALPQVPAALPTVPSINTNFNPIATPTTAAPKSKARHLTNEFECPANVNKYFASPRACNEYYICADGLSFKFTCTPPLKWNSQNNFCDWPINVRCNTKTVKTKPAPVPPKRVVFTRKPTTTRTTTTTTTTTTTPKPALVLPSFPSSAGQMGAISPSNPPFNDWYSFLTEFWRIMSRLGTSSGAFLDIKEPAGSSTSGVSIPRQERSYCADKTDGIYPDPKDCTKFIECVQKRAHNGDCPKGLAFDTRYGVCDYIHKVKRCAVQRFRRPV